MASCMSCKGRSRQLEPRQEVSDRSGWVEQLGSLLRSIHSHSPPRHLRIGNPANTVIASLRIISVPQYTQHCFATDLTTRSKSTELVEFQTAKYYFVEHSEPQLYSDIVRLSI